jgi:NAD-dependent dihydropyrimidine dehydrogenase PreA subunit
MLRSVTRILDQENRRRQALSGTWVVSDGARCVQCGICSYNCPMGIDTRGYAWRDEPVSDRRCIACGECVMRCPRRVLRFELQV